jgi:hypothetical protein
MKRLVTVLFVIAAGCSTSPSARVVPVDKDTYKVTSPAVGVRSDERKYVYDKATRFCGSQNKGVEVVTLDGRGPASPGSEYFRLPDAPRATLLFKCVARTPGSV